jgi:hypothetical protein
MLYYDQLNVISQHLKDIKVEENLITPNNSTVGICHALHRGDRPPPAPNLGTDMNTPSINHSGNQLQPAQRSQQLRIWESHRGS